MKRPLNFLHLTTFYPPYSFGGDAMYIYRLAHALGDLGHHVDVIHDRDAYYLQHPSEPEIDFADHPNVKRHGLKSKYRWLSPLLTHQTGQPLLKRQPIEEIIRESPYDVFHYHNISLLGPGILAIEPPQGKVLKIYTTHEHWLICPTHVLWKFNKRACDKPECLRCTLLARRPPQLWRYWGLLEVASKNVHRFLSPSKFTAGMHERRGFPQPVHHLPYFIDRADEDWQNPGQPPQDSPYFLFVGRLEKIKGLETLINLWNLIPDADLLVVGTGNQDQELRELASGNPRIKFLGALPPTALGNLYYHAQATLVPSITFETFGIIIIESFARKTPVIVRDLGALSEVVEESGGGYSFQTDTELLNGIQRIQASHSLRRSLGEKGYQAFLKYWSKEAHIDMYFDMLRTVARQNLGYIPWE